MQLNRTRLCEITKIGGLSVIPKLKKINLKFLKQNNCAGSAEFPWVLF